MEVTVTSKGPGLAALTNTVVSRLTQANRSAGRDIAKLGRTTVLKASGSPTFRGRALKVKKTRTKARADGATVEIYGSPAGAWTILDTGARAHPIRPKAAKVLKFGSIYAAHVAHPGTSGSGVWSKTAGPLERALFGEINDIYDEALDV